MLLAFEQKSPSRDELADEVCCTMLTLARELKNVKSYHAVVVIRKNAAYIVVTESGMNNHAVWAGSTRTPPNG